MSRNAAKPFVCPWWIGYFLISPLRRLWQNPGEIIAPYVKEGMTVLDIGPGMGYFSLEMAWRVGARGRVICADIQRKMLDVLKKRAAKAGLEGRITGVVASNDSLGLDTYKGSADFALLFAVVHEVPDQAGLFRQLYHAMKPGGVILLSEPKGHVTDQDFLKTIELAKAAGFAAGDSPDIKHGLSRILKKG